MVFQMIGRALKALFKKPLRVFGLSMFVTLLMYLGCVLFFGIPAAGLVIGILMYTSLNWMYLRVLRGETGIAAKDMLDVFKDKETFVRVLKGMAWKYLWIFIWGLIPIAGFVFALIKIYEYRLVPYILLDDPDVDPLDALKISSQKTKGYRGRMFLNDFIIAAICTLAFGSIIGSTALFQFAIGAPAWVTLGYFGIGWLVFGVLLALCAMVSGLVHAGYYEEIEHPTPKPVRVRAEKRTAKVAITENTRFCPRCGNPYIIGEARFCAKCGHLLETDDAPEEQPAAPEEEPTVSAEDSQE